jgi:hypothetical protein
LLVFLLYLSFFHKSTFHYCFGSLNATVPDAAVVSLNLDSLECFSEFDLLEYVVSLNLFDTEFNRDGAAAACYKGTCEKQYECEDRRLFCGGASGFWSPKELR